MTRCASMIFTLEPKCLSNVKLKVRPGPIPPSSPSEVFVKVHDFGEETLPLLSGAPSPTSQLNGPSNELAMFTTSFSSVVPSSSEPMLFVKSTRHPVSTPLKVCVNDVIENFWQLPLPPIITFGSTASAFATDAAAQTKVKARKSLHNFKGIPLTPTYISATFGPQCSQRAVANSPKFSNLQPLLSSPIRECADYFQITAQYRKCSCAFTLRKL
jgi:hypothetical protein